MAKKVKISAGIALDGEKEFKKAIASVNSEAKVLASEMKLLTQSFSGNQNSMEALTKKDKALNEQVDKQKEKINALKLALEHAKTEYGENDTRVDGWKTSLNNAKIQLMKLDSELQDNKKYLGEAKTSTNKTATSIDEYGRKVKIAGKETTRFRDLVKANLTTTGIVAGISVLGNLVGRVGEKAKDTITDTAEMSETIEKQSQAMGISTKKYQEWAYMLSLNGTNIGRLKVGFKTLNNQMVSAQDGAKNPVSYFKRIGIAMDDLKGKSREQVFDMAVKGLQGVKSSSEKAYIASKLFGKGGQELIPMLNKSSEETEKLRKKANDLGIVLSDKTVKSGGELAEEMKTLDGTTKGLNARIGSALIPTFTDLTKKATEFVGKNEDKIADFTQNTVGKLGDALKFCIDNSKTLTVTFGLFVGAMAIGKFVNYTSAMISGFKTIKGAIDAARTSQLLLNAAETASPLGAALAVLGAVATAEVVLMNKRTDQIRKATDLTTAQKKLVASVTKEKETIDNLKSTKITDINGIEESTGKTKKYITELRKIVTEDGRIKKGYQNRAKTITGILSDAMGVEIKIVGNQIQGYKKLNKTLDATLDKKKAQAILDASGEEYTNAVKNVKAAKEKEKSLAKSVEKAKELKALLEREEKNAKKNRDEHPDDPLLAGFGYAPNDSAWNDAKEKLENQRKSVKKLESAYKSAKGNAGNYSKSIRDYETLNEAVYSGSTTKIKKAINQIEGYMNDQKNTSKKIGKDTGKAYGDGVASDENKSNAKTSGKAVANSANSGMKTGAKLARKSGQNFVEGFVLGTDGKKTYLQEKMQKLAQHAFKGFNSKKGLDVNSPSKKAIKSGKSVVEGFALGLDNNAKTIGKTMARLGSGAVASLNSSINAQTIPMSATTSFQARTAQAQSAIASGDLTIQVPIDGMVVTKSVVKNFRNLSASDPSVKNVFK